MQAEKIHSKDKDKNKDKIISSIPKLSNIDYIKLLNQYGNLEKHYKLVKDENHTLNLVAWRKLGPIDSPSGLVQLSTPIEDIEK